MADQFYDDVPARAQNIGTAIDQTELTLGWIKDVLQTICSYSDDTLTNIVVGNRGLISLRPQLSYKDADEIYLDAMALHHAGTTDQMVYSSSQLTFQLGSGGSNAGSEDLDAGAIEWQYLYIDDSVLVSDATNVIDETRILNSNEAPAWDDAQYGWYPSSNGTYVETTDRCIGAVPVQADNNLMEFWHEGDLFLIGTPYIGRTLADLDTSWTDVTLAGPTFSTRCRATFECAAANASSEEELSYRTNGATGDGYVVGHSVASAGNDMNQFNTVDVITDATYKIEVKMSGAGLHQVGVLFEGYYYPIGM